MKQSLFRKILFLIIVFSLIPFIFINFYYYYNLKKISSYAINRSKLELDKKAIESLITQATNIADKISQFLYSCVNDLNDLTLVTPLPEKYLKFSMNHEKEVYVREPTFSGNYFLEKKYLPIYKKIFYLSNTGTPIIKIENNCIVKPELKDILIKKVIQKKLIKLNNGQIFISHLLGYYVSKPEQLAGAESPEKAIGGKKYNGFYIFAKKTGNNIILLCLNAIHIMEFVMHVLPNSNKFIDYPVYSSGNYAFLVDDEGWTIAHPKLWDIKGYSKNGTLIPPYSKNTPVNLIKKGIIPFNLKTAGFIHKNYPIVLIKLRKRETGFVNTTNIGGINKVMAFAPIFFNVGDYKKYGIFGGVTIGAKVDDFHKEAIETQQVIYKEFYSIKNNIVIVTFIIILFIILGSFYFTLQLTSPIIMLSRRFVELGKGNLENIKVKFSQKDEIGVLGREFNKMVDLIKENNEKLSSTIKQLEKSKYELEFKVNLLDGLREFFTRFNYHSKLNEILNSFLFIGKKIFKYNFAIITIFENMEFKIGFIEPNENSFKLSNPIIIDEDVKGVYIIHRVGEDFSKDEIKNFEIFSLSISKFLENLKLYSEIIKERNFIENIFKNMINGLIYINQDGYITHINDMACNLFNLIQKDVVGKKFREVFKDNPTLINLYFDTIKGEKFMAYEVKYGDRYLGFSSSLVEKDNGVIMIFRDVTEKKITDENLKRLDRFVSMGRLAAGIAHEIRNPLTGINLLLEDLHDQLQREDRILIKKALDEITRLENIVSELLDYASPVKETQSETNLSEVIESSLFFIKKQAKQKGITIKTNFKFRGSILLAQEKMKQAFINILINSLDAIENRGEIVINTFERDNYVIIEFIDNGSGISESNLKYIFDPFFTTKKQGTGLGLSITQNIIIEHNGTIEIESEQGKGTKVIIKLNK